MAALATIPSKPTTATGDYYGIKAAAQKLGVGERWLRDGVNHGGFPHSRLGKFIVFDASDLAEIYRMFRVPAHTPRRGRRAA